MRKLKWMDLAIGAGLGLLARNIARIAYTTGESMQPTLRDGQLVLVACLSQPKKGELVAFKNRGEGPKHLVKRVVAVGGDTVGLRLTRLYVNGQAAHEPYLKEIMRTKAMEEVTVPEGTVFVLGDNRNHSLDSRKLGPVPLKDVIGVVWHASKR
ncbi:MAG: signal peptidase I [Turicibacter sp.]|nr:signal peptidase I [Turicibacter sp.]